MGHLPSFDCYWMSLPSDLSRHFRRLPSSVSFDNFSTIDYYAIRFRRFPTPSSLPPITPLTSLVTRVYVITPRFQFTDADWLVDAGLSLMPFSPTRHAFDYALMAADYFAASSRHYEYATTRWLLMPVIDVIDVISAGYCWHWLVIKMHMSQHYSLPFIELLVITPYAYFTPSIMPIAADTRFTFHFTFLSISAVCHSLFWPITLYVISLMVDASPDYTPRYCFITPFHHFHVTFQLRHDGHAIADWRRAATDAAAFAVYFTPLSGYGATPAFWSSLVYHSRKIYERKSIWW